MNQNASQSPDRPAVALPPFGVWLPIETAPKSGLIDIWTVGFGAESYRVCDCYKDTICDEWRTSRPMGYLHIIPARFVTHWMARPQAPNAEPNSALDARGLGVLRGILSALAEFTCATPELIVGKLTGVLFTEDEAKHILGQNAQAHPPGDLLSALRHWRIAEKRHAMIVLGELAGDKAGANDVAQRALHALRIQADKALSAEPTQTMPNPDKTPTAGSGRLPAAHGSALYQRTIETYTDPLTRRAWERTPWMLDVFTDSYDSARHRAIMDWCEETFGTESRPIAGIMGEWNTGGAMINGWTWMGFASESQMARFAAHWQNDLAQRPAGAAEPK